MSATETVPSSLADLHEASLTEMAALSPAAIDEALSRILLDEPVASPDFPKFNSTI